MSAFAGTPLVDSGRSTFWNAQRCGFETRANRLNVGENRRRQCVTTNRKKKHEATRMILGGIQLPWGKKNDDAPLLALNFDIGYAYLANPEKNTSEDAFFVEGNSAGVFDGVSGAYESRGVDPRRYSQMLAALTQEGVRQSSSTNVVKCVFDAAELNREIGASTACVVGMDSAGRVFGINLGDSGTAIIRGSKMIFRTKEQQHFFNCPYQLSSDGEDTMQMGENVQSKVRDGDWLILATDGLFDNVPDKDIVRIAGEFTDPNEFASELADVATANSYDESKESPFERNAKKSGVKWKGGKLDDITIVAIKIRDNADIKPMTLLSVLPEIEEELASGDKDNADTAAAEAGPDGGAEVAEAKKAADESEVSK